MDLLEAARRWAAAGFSVIPVSTDGSKAPAVAWKPYQTEAASPGQLWQWFEHGDYDGLGVICGRVSGGLELLEVEGRAVADTLPPFRTALVDNGFGPLWDRLNGGYLEQSPSGGLHWLFRVDGEPRGNTKLARRPATADELAHDPADKVKVLLETRGEGGFVVVAPSGGRTHPTGKSWRALVGGPDTVPTISVDERDALYAIAAMFDQMPSVEVSAPWGVLPGDGASGNRPGDEYNARASWDDVLDGWTRVRRFGGTCYGWVRPGKDPRAGISATTGRNDGDNLYVFSSSTEFEPERPYSKFAAYALLQHGGDYSAAASALRAEGYGSPPEQPRPAAVVEAMDHEPDVAGGTNDTPPAPVLTYSATDDGNALRLADTYGDRLRFCKARGSWLAWNGRRWTWDDGAAVELARLIARGLPGEDKAAQRHRHHSLSWRGLSAMERISRSDPRLRVDLGHLDAEAYELNTPGGVVDLRTGKLHDPDPAKLHTRSTTVAPEFGTEPVRWLRFLADTFAGDPALTLYVQRLLGLSLIGRVLEPVLPFGLGEGANGKSTLMNVAQGILGGDDGYATTAPAELLIATAHRGHPTEIARLSGVRLVVASELEEGERFAEARIKMLTGKDQIAGRFMGKDFFRFNPTHTIWLLGNDQPAIRSGGPALWRRLRLVRFLHVVPEAERVADLDAQLIDAEGPEILAWMVAGAVDYLREGLAEPDSVRVATHEYEKDQDTVGRFVADMCETGDPNAQHMTVRVAAVRAAYERWCAQEGESPVTVKALTQALRRGYGILSTRDMRGRFYSGIRLNDTADDDTPWYDK